MPNNYIIELKQIIKSFVSSNKIQTNVLKGIDIQIKKGEFLALMGPSGAGKSTLLSIMGCIDTADSGQVLFNDSGSITDYSILNVNALADFRSKNIGFVFQFHHLLPEFTAIENVMLPALIAGDTFKNSRNRAMNIIDKIGLNHRITHKPAALSGGEQQRLAIARAVINNPKIILADEPTGNLDEANSKMVIDLLLDLIRENQTTLIIATHSNEIASRADSIIRLKDGLIVN